MIRNRHTVPFTLVLWITTSWLFVQARTPWTLSRVDGSPEPAKPYHVERVYPRLEFQQPVELMPLADTGKMMLLERTGKLFTFDHDPACQQADLLIDLSTRIDHFQNAYGFALHPDFQRNGQLFVVYGGGPDARPDGTRLSRFTMSRSEPFVMDPESEQILLTWHSGGHNGSAIRFDSKGYLYFSTGDGARPFPPDEYGVGQDLSDLRSTICRIDVSRQSDELPYAIPEDNPFLNTPDARPEIWAYGFRNPWRFTIVPETDQLLCGDVGWELWELVFDVKRAGNYGWSLVEGPQPIRQDITPGPTPVQPPLVAYPHAVGQSVTGGHVYRGVDHEQLRGAYLYGDYVTGLLWGLRHEGDRVTWNPVLAETGLAIITFAETPDREMLIVAYDGGIYQLVKNPGAGRPASFPRALSETGLFESTVSLEPAPGVFSYRPTVSAWADGAASDFLIGIPGAATIQVAREQRQWRYPAGTVFAKTLSVESKRMETQLLHFDGINWHPYSYRWNEDQTDAELVEDAGQVMAYETRDSSGQRQQKSWVFQNRAQCRACHSRQNGGAVGFSFENLSHQQVESLVQDAIVDRDAPAGWQIARMVDPVDDKHDLDARARSYLAANCAHCHRRGGGGTVAMDLAYSSTPETCNAIDVLPSQGTFGIPEARVIAAGDPSRSTLFYRLATTGLGHMPKVWARDNDLAGLLLVHDWIASMKTAELSAPQSPPQPTDPSAAVTSDTSQALQQFAGLLKRSPHDADVVDVARRAAVGAEPQIAALFERFLPASERRKRLGDQIDAASILAIQGDAERGRQLFFQAASQQCILCHRVQGKGQSVGPDLDGIGGKRSAAELLESIVEPSRVVDPKFTTQIVVADDGRIVTGLLIEESERSIVIRAADGKDQAIEKDHIESRRLQSESLMPKGLAAGMTAEELADILAFLGALR